LNFIENIVNLSDTGVDMKASTIIYILDSTQGHQKTIIGKTLLLRNNECYLKNVGKRDNSIQ
jgi:hypothetical protein